MSKRFIDLLILLILLIPFLFIFSFIFTLLYFSSNESVLYWSDRVGKDNNLFKMVKFRTMKSDTPALASHLLEDPELHLIKYGSFLRATSLDEIPQFWNILIGEMTFVGPRPALYNQNDLIQMRSEYGVHKLTPGLTGLAQISGRDEIPLSEKVKFDIEYSRNHSLYLDFKILFATFRKVITREDVTH
ncbi:MAG: hypothetical protein RLY43_1807 [Bacteroidota bacterium]|jgi:O-antigen biosynthesis protein WbqP